jgi:hypothetical protein
MSASPNENPVEGLSQFFDYIWGSETGFVYLPYKVKDSGDWKKVMFEWPKSREAVLQHTLVKSAEGHDVYFAPTMFSEASPKKESAKGANVLWADFDGTIPNSFKALGGPERPATPDPVPESQTMIHSPESGTQPRTEASHGIPFPSLRVQSSTNDHQHVYWRLESFETDIGWIESSNRSIAYSLKADTSGWDVNQVLRPPGTTNYKHNLPVSIFDEYDARYGRGNFASLAPVKQLVSEALDVAEIPDVTRVVAKYVFDDDHYKLFMQPTVEEGHRSSALMKVGFFGAESGMTDAEIYSLLLNADERWGKFKNRTDRKKRLLDIVNRARLKYPEGFKIGAGLLKEVSDDAPVDTPKYVYGFEEFLNTEINIEWAFEGLLEHGGIGVISSPPGIGKTQTSIQLGISGALGYDFLKWKPVKKMKILILSLEMSHASLKHFMTTIARQYNPTEISQLERNLKIVPLGEPLPFDTPEGKKFLEALLDEYKPDGVIIDSMGKVTNASLSEEVKIKELNAYYVHLRNKYGCFLWFIHHNRKATDNNKRPTDLSDLYGNQYIAAETTSVLCLWKEKDGSLTISELKNRLSQQGEPFAVERNSNLHFTIAEKPVGAGLLSEVRGDTLTKEKHDPDTEPPPGNALFKL